MEFFIGKTLANSLINTGMEEEIIGLLEKLGIELHEVSSGHFQKV